MNEFNLTRSKNNSNIGISNGFFKRALGFPSYPKKTVAGPYNYCDVDTWWLVNTRSRFSRSTFHLHSFLRANLCIF